MTVQQGRHPGPMPPALGRSGLSIHGRALPIAVAAGLAMGVFAGLVVVRGTGGSDDGAARTTSAAGAGATHRHPGDAGAGTVVPAATSDAGARLTQAGLADAAPAAPPPDAAPPPPARARVSFTVDPEGATITADGKPVKGGALDVALGPDGTATVNLTVRAHGYHSLHKSYTVRGDRAIRLELHKSHHTPTHHHPTGPGGLIKL